MHFRHAVQVPVQRRPDPLDYLRMRQIAAAIGNAQRSQAEPRGRYAGHGSRIAAASQVVARAIENLACFWAGLLPEKETALPLQIVKECLIFLARFPRLTRKGHTPGCKGASGRRGQRCEHLAPVHAPLTAYPGHRNFSNSRPGTQSY